MPSGFAIGAPEDRQGPARQLLAWIPLALPKVQEAALTVPCSQFVHQLGRQPSLGGAQSIGVPFGAIAIVDRHKGRLATHGEAHILTRQIIVDLGTQGVDVGPLLVGIGLGDPGRLVDASDGHEVLKLDLALVHTTGHGGCACGLGRTGHGDVPLARQQTGSGIQANPARPRQEHLTPGVQVGEVDVGARRAIERRHVCLQLNQVARHEARRQAHVA